MGSSSASCLPFAALCLVSIAQDRSVVSMSSQDGGGGLNLGALSPDQLKQVADQLSQESQRLTESFEGLQSAINKYNRSASTLKKFKDESEGKEMLVPLTSSMYVRGSLEETSKILVELEPGIMWKSLWKVEPTSAKGK